MQCDNLEFLVQKEDCIILTGIASLLAEILLTFCVLFSSVRTLGFS